MIASQNLLSKKALSLLINDDQRGGKWLLFNSSTEALLKTVLMMRFFGYNSPGIYINGSRLSVESPAGHTVKAIDTENVEAADFSDLDFVVLRLNNKISNTHIKRIINKLRVHKPVVISDETSFESFIQVDKSKELKDLLDVRIFGSWVSAGLSFSCVFVNENFLQKKIKNMRFNDFFNIFLQDY
jgi:hypothetical protein